MADHDISKALRSLRRQLGITQDALSKELHISRQLYAFYENGVRIPDAEMACELADFHHLTVNSWYTDRAVQRKRFSHPLL